MLNNKHSLIKELEEQANEVDGEAVRVKFGELDENMEGAIYKTKDHQRLFIINQVMPVQKIKKCYKKFIKILKSGKIRHKGLYVSVVGHDDIV